MNVDYRLFSHDFICKCFQEFEFKFYANSALVWVMKSAFSFTEQTSKIQVGIVILINFAWQCNFTKESLNVWKTLVEIREIETSFKTKGELLIFFKNWFVLYALHRMLIIYVIWIWLIHLTAFVNNFLFSKKKSQYIYSYRKICWHNNLFNMFYLD